jgi:tetratricopeptide (TPR) repeat protein
MNYYSFWQARQYSIVLQELEQHRLSSDVMRSIFLELLRPNSVIVRFFAANNDLDVIRYSAARERLSKAISLIQSDQFDLARQELDIAYRLYSQDIEPVVSCYPLLVKAGQQDFAQQLFTQFESALLNQIRQWPEDAMSLNNLAWMYAKCGVKLDEALDLSRQAVKLVPSSAVYLDTLAEVQYRRGEVDLAIETMRNCARIDPRAPGYRKNLVRFSTGKP